MRVARFALITLLFACSNGEESETTTIASLSSPDWPSVVVPVCFENRGAFPAEAGWIEDAVEQLWDRGSALELGDWGPCASNQSGIHVRIGTAATSTTAIGVQLDGVNDGIVVNADPCQGTCTPAEREAAVRLQAVKVFEQALVISGTSLDPTTCVAGEVVETCTWPARLTYTSYNYLVGRFGATSGTLRHRLTGAWCLTANAEGEPVRMERCDDSSAQHWQHREHWAPPRFHQPLESTDGLCVRPKDALPYEPLVMYACGGAQWTMNLSGGAEDPARGWLRGAKACTLTTTDNLVACDYSGFPLAPFVLDAPSLFGFTIFTSEAKCVMPVSYGGAPLGRGDLVLAVPCSADDPDSKWVWEDGRLRHFVSGLCMRAPWVDEEQPAVTLDECSDQVAVRWSFDAPIALDGTGLCVNPFFTTSLYVCPDQYPPGLEILTFTYTP